MRRRILIGAIIIMILGAIWSPAAGAHRGSGDYILLHVIANSDSASDQAVKHRVRDAILDAYGDTFASEKDIAEAEHAIYANLAAITDIAGKTLRDNGMPYGAVSKYGMFPFPTRQYGDCILPAGEYHALRVILGDGSGANWWCVLFPPLCVHDTSDQEQANKQGKGDTGKVEKTEEAEKPEETEITEEPEKSEKTGDSTESQTETVSRDEKESRPKIKFKIVEWVKGIFK